MNAQPTPWLEGFTTFDLYHYPRCAARNQLTDVNIPKRRLCMHRVSAESPGNVCDITGVRDGDGTPYNSERRIAGLHRPDSDRSLED